MSKQYYLRFEPYQRKFKQPLRTSHGLWRVREGIIINLRNSENQVSQGEIAPIPWFGSETIAEAKEFCQQQGNIITEETIRNIPDSLPACQFAFESALLNLECKTKPVTEKQFNCCYLLPTGKQALVEEFSATNIETTYKWKIGIDKPATEIAIFEQLLSKLPANAKIRLDANGGLTVTEACQWLKYTEHKPQVEFIEQPLPPTQLQEIIELNNSYQTNIALDESVAKIEQLIECYNRGWRDIFVLKAAIMGHPSRLRQFCQQHKLDLVFSSVFETPVGRQAALQLASELGNQNRAMGFGVSNWLM